MFNGVIVDPLTGIVTREFCKYIMEFNPFEDPMIDIIEKIRPHWQNPDICKFAMARPRNGKRKLKLNPMENFNNTLLLNALRLNRWIFTIAWHRTSPEGDYEFIIPLQKSKYDTQYDYLSDRIDS